MHFCERAKNELKSCEGKLDFNFYSTICGKSFIQSTIATMFIIEFTTLVKNMIQPKNSLMNLAIKLHNIFNLNIWFLKVINRKDIKYVLTNFSDVSFKFVNYLKKCSNTKKLRSIRSIKSVWSSMEFFWFLWNSNQSRQI